MGIDYVQEQKKQARNECARKLKIANYIFLGAIVTWLGITISTRIYTSKLRNYDKPPIVQEYLDAINTNGQLEAMKQRVLKYKPKGLDKEIEYIFEPNHSHLERAVSSISASLRIMEENKDVALYNERMNVADNRDGLGLFGSVFLFISIGFFRSYYSAMARKKRDKKLRELVQLQA